MSRFVISSDLHSLIDLRNELRPVYAEYGRAVFNADDEASARQKKLRINNVVRSRLRLNQYDKVPGIYFWLTDNQEISGITYIGQSSNLDNRLTNWFRDDTAFDDSLNQQSPLEFWREALAQMDKSMPRTAMAKRVEYAFNHTRTRKFADRSNYLLVVRVSDHELLRPVESLLIHSAVWLGAPLTNIQNRMDFKSFGQLGAGLREAKEVIGEVARHWLSDGGATAWAGLINDLQDHLASRAAA